MIRATEPGDIEAVLANPSAITRAEFPYGLPASRRDGIIAETIAIPHPVAVAAHRQRDGYCSTWFIATEEGLRQVRELRRIVRRRAAVYGVIRSTTQSKHPQRDRWFRLLGMSPVSPTTYEAR